MMVVKFRGDVAAVQAAVEAGVGAAEKLSAMVIGHVIPRPGYIEWKDKIILSKERGN